MIARVSIVAGLILCGVTVAGMIATTQKHGSVFLPMMVGIPLLFLGVVSLNPHWRRTAMWFAGTLAGGGGLFGLVRMIAMLAGTLTGRPVHWVSLETLAAMVIVCGTFVLAVVLWTRRRQRRPTRRSGRMLPGHDAAAKPREPVTHSDNPYHPPPVVDPAGVDLPTIDPAGIDPAGKMQSVNLRPPQADGLSGLNHPPAASATALMAAPPAHASGQHTIAS